MPSVCSLRDSAVGVPEASGIASYIDVLRLPECLFVMKIDSNILRAGAGCAVHLQTKVRVIYEPSEVCRRR
jgi:hypothetical protein